MSCERGELSSTGEAAGFGANGSVRDTFKGSPSDPKAAVAGGGVLVPAAASLAELTDIVERRHHEKTRKLLSEIEELTVEAIGSAGPLRGGNIAELRRAIETFAADMERHLFEEETALFPYFRELDAFARDAGPRPHLLCGSARYPISARWKEHEDTGENLAGLRKLAEGYMSSPSDPEAICRLRLKLRELEDELEEHIRLENEVLFPLALETERKLGI